MSSFSQGGFLRCRLLALSLRPSLMVPGAVRQAWRGKVLSNEAGRSLKSHWAQTQGRQKQQYAQWWCSQLRHWSPASAQHWHVHPFLVPLHSPQTARSMGSPFSTSNKQGTWRYLAHAGGDTRQDLPSRSLHSGNYHPKRSKCLRGATCDGQKTAMTAAWKGQRGSLWPAT